MGNERLVSFDVFFFKRRKKDGEKEKIWEGGLVPIEMMRMMTLNEMRKKFVCDNFERNENEKEEGERFEKKKKEMKI